MEEAEPLSISTAIARLQAILDEHGDIPVATVLEEGEQIRFCIIATFEVVEVDGEKPGTVDKLCVLLEPVFSDGTSDEVAPDREMVN